MSACVTIGAGLIDHGAPSYAHSRIEAKRKARHAFTPPAAIPVAEDFEKGYVTNDANPEVYSDLIPEKK